MVGKGRHRSGRQGWGLQFKYQSATFRRPCLELQLRLMKKLDNDLDDALVNGGWTPGGRGSSRGSEVKWRG